jgi:hypothetical protein
MYYQGLGHAIGKIKILYINNNISESKIIIGMRLLNQHLNLLKIYCNRNISRWQ